MFSVKALNTGDKEVFMPKCDIGSADSQATFRYISPNELGSCTYTGVRAVGILARGSVALCANGGPYDSTLATS